MKTRRIEINTLPSFNHIKDIKLRSQNRGAILANIYEVYRQVEDQLLYSLDVYLNKIPKEDQAISKYCMLVHLEKSGYYIES